jgi:hypothetical protein
MIRKRGAAMPIRMRLLPNRFTAVICSLLLISFSALSTAAEQGQPQSQGSGQDAPKITNDQLDSLVAPIALYPDPLLAQVLAASTYPLEIIQLQQWLAEHMDLKDQALQDAVQKEDWDPSVQALASLPDALKQLADNIKWTTDLGNAFLAQQSDVMDAVQRMRKKAQDVGNLKSNQQQKVETKTVENKTVVVVEQADPQVVYVPSYNPTVVFGPPVYPYPLIAYPPLGAYVAGAAISFGVGVAIGAAFHGGWGWHCGWGHNNVNINRNNTYVRNSNFNRTGNNTWQHNPQHRAGTPYSNQAVANRYGGTTRGSSQAARQSSARQNIGQEKARGQQFGGPSRSGGESSFGRGGRGNGGQGSFGGGAGGGERVGNRSASMGGGSESRGGGGFGGGGFSSSGAGSGASSSRGFSSMGGGGFRGGGRRR